MAPSSPGGKRGPGRPLGGKPLAGTNDFLQAAEALLRRDGAEQLTLAKVANEAGVSKPMLYRHVGDKHALILALAERLTDRITLAIESETAKATSAQDAIHRMVITYLRALDQDRAIYIYVTTGAVGADPVGEALHLADRSAGPLQAGFVLLRERSGADPSVARSWAYATVGMLHFVGLAWIREPHTDLETLAAHISELLWFGVGPIPN